MLFKAGARAGSGGGLSRAGAGRGGPGAAGPVPVPVSRGALPEPQVRGHRGREGVRARGWPVPWPRGAAEGGELSGIARASEGTGRTGLGTERVTLEHT